MIAYHFPPLAGSSGIQRTLRFVQHLPALGWQPLVLSVTPRAYEKTSDDLLADVPPGTVVRRAFGFDTARHLAVAGRYFGWMARPDRWVSWQFDAIRQGRKLIREFKPDIIWSTYPIATAHVIAAALHRQSGIPWVADFRDPMVQIDYPTDLITRQSFKKIEERAANEAALCTFTTPGAARLYAQRYPHAADRFRVIENGYDEETFAGITPGGVPLNPGKITLLHSGIVYPSERDPTQLLQAVRALIDAGQISTTQFCIRFRASMHEAFLQTLIDKFNLSDCIELLPPVSYSEALNEMMRADILLIMQATNCNDQIPAKLYEYLRAGRPILALTDPVGDTASALREAGISAIAPLNQASVISEALSKILVAPTIGTLPTADAVNNSSRRNRTKQFATLLDAAYSRTLST